MIMPNRIYALQSLSHMVVDKAQAKDELTEAVSTSQEVLATATTVWPFTFFPDTVSIDRTNLTITHRLFFKVAVIVSIKIEDILNITPNIGPFFGSLRLVTTFVDPQNPYVVNYLRRDDVLKITRILKGYKVALEQKIDCSTLNKEELGHLLDNLARDGTET